MALCTRWQGETDIIHAQHAEGLAGLAQFVGVIRPRLRADHPHELGGQALSAVLEVRPAPCLPQQHPVPLALPLDGELMMLAA